MIEEKFYVFSLKYFSKSFWCNYFTMFMSQKWYKFVIYEIKWWQKIVNKFIPFLTELFFFDKFDNKFFYSTYETIIHENGRYIKISINFLRAFIIISIMSFHTSVSFIHSNNWSYSISVYKNYDLVSLLRTK